jgi:hypothetical protein
MEFSKTFDFMMRFGIWDVASRIGSISTNLYEKLILVDLESTVWVVETQPSEIGSFSERS